MRPFLLPLLLSGILAVGSPARAEDWLVKPGHFPQLTEPPCSYCITEHRKGRIAARESEDMLLEI